MKTDTLVEISHNSLKNRITATDSRPTVWWFGTMILANLWWGWGFLACFAFATLTAFGVWLILK